MKIKELFQQLKSIIENKESCFMDSGMVNESNVLDYGFFPLGSGILKEGIQSELAEIPEQSLMILGNDYGTLSYLNKDRLSRIESKSKTVDNLLSKLKLDCNTTFFTNFYLGVRNDIEHPTASMTKLAKPLQDCYKKLCFEFFKKQVELLNPKVVICLGHAVRLALFENYINTPSFSKWKSKAVSMNQLYNDSNHIVEEGGIKFILTPHPCDLRNFRNYHIDKINSELLNI